MEETNLTMSSDHGAGQKKAEQASSLRSPYRGRTKERVETRRDEVRCDESRRFEATREECIAESRAGQSVVLPDVGVCPVEQIASGWQAELRQRQTELTAHGLIARVE
jgi:hypothetical protein